MDEDANLNECPIDEIIIFQSIRRITFALSYQAGSGLESRLSQVGVYLKMFQFYSRSGLDTDFFTLFIAQIIG